MSNPNARSSGRRPGRGPRRQGHQRDESRGPAQSPEPKHAPKQSFLQKLVGFFTGKKKSSNGAAAHTETRRASYPAYSSGGSSTGNRDDVRPASAQSLAPSRPTRKPEAVEVTTPKLYVGNLSFDATESDLSQLFAGIGAVRVAEVVSHKDTEKSKGFGFVTMSTIDEAARAVEVLHDKDFMGRKLVVSGAKTPPDRG